MSIAVATATAEARTHRIVLLDFDGPRDLATVGRDSLLSVFGERYEVVSADRWNAARERVRGRAPEQWQQAAQRCRLDAVIDGWIQADSHEHTLNLAVRDAATGNELETFSVGLHDDGIASADGRKLAKKIERALAARDEDTTDTKEVADVQPSVEATGAKVTRGKRFEIATGVFVASRGMKFSKRSSAGPDYPSSGVQGLAVAAAAYPLPLVAGSDQLSGFGVELGIEKAAGASVSVPANGSYALDHAAYVAGVHLRYPFARVSLDAGIDYGKTAFTTALPATAGIPDVAYRYVAIRARVDTEIRKGARAGIGASSMYLLGAGDVVSAMSYGAAEASGYQLDASTRVAIDQLLYVTGALAYRRFGLDLDKSGDLAVQNGVSGIADSTVSATITLGMAF